MSQASENDRDDFTLCNDCGGLCCALYLAHDEDGAYVGEGWLPDYIALWEGRLTASGALLADGERSVAGTAGVKPLHDPRISHLPTSEGAAYRASLPVWVDVRKCQFCHPETGCLLPRSHRPPICGAWVCELWETAEARRETHDMIAAERNGRTPDAPSQERLR